MSARGHLFVVHGKIETLVHDAAVIPVDGRLDFNDIWKPLLGPPLAITSIDLGPGLGARRGEQPVAR